LAWTDHITEKIAELLFTILLSFFWGNLNNNLQWSPFFLFFVSDVQGNLYLRKRAMHYKLQATNVCIYLYSQPTIRFFSFETKSLYEAIHIYTIVLLQWSLIQWSSTDWIHRDPVIAHHSYFIWCLFHGTFSM
jgi:hypothetical protein